MSAGRSDAVARSDASANDARRARVERGLIPPTVIAGRAVPQHALEERMRHHGVPAVSMALIDGGRVAWSRGYGARTPGDAPATVATRFQAASLSKGVTALVALRLVARGVLPLDADVRPMLRAWRLPEAAHGAAHGPTLRQLLSHTAGVSVPSFPGYPAGTPLPTLRHVLDGAPPANTPAVRLDTMPGVRWRYSGGGYAIVQQLIEERTGRPFAEVARDEVLAPLGMDASAFEQPLLGNAAALAAVGHRDDGTAVPGGWYTYPELAAAGLWTTGGDLARLVVALQRALRGAPDAILPSALARAMVTPLQANYALGLAVLGAGTDSAYFTHVGVNEGFRAVLVGFVEREQGAVILTNGAGGVDLAYELLRGVAREYGWSGFRPRTRTLVAAAPETLRALAGRYRLVAGTDTTLVSVHADGDALAVTLPPRATPLVFHPTVNERFFTQDAGVELAFVRASDGGVTGLRVLGAGPLPVASRVP